MYKIESFHIPAGYTVSSYSHKLLIDIKNNIHVEENTENLFRLVYPTVYRKTEGYANSYGRDLVDSVIGIAFAKSVHYFDHTKPFAAFIQYLLLTLKAEILQERYGNMCKTPEKRELKRCVENESIDIDAKFFNLDGTSYSLSEAIPDPSLDLEENILNQELIKEIYRAVDKVTQTKKPSPRADRVRLILKTFIDYKIEGKYTTSEEIALQFDITRYALSHILTRWLPRVRRELQKRGY